MTRDGDVHRVRVLEAVPLVDGAAGEVEEVAGFEHNVKTRRADLTHAEIGARDPEKRRRLLLPLPCIPKCFRM